VRRDRTLVWQFTQYVRACGPQRRPAFRRVKEGYDVTIGIRFCRVRGGCQYHARDDGHEDGSPFQTVFHVQIPYQSIDLYATLNNRRAGFHIGQEPGNLHAIVRSVKRRKHIKQDSRASKAGNQVSAAVFA